MSLSFYKARHLLIMSLLFLIFSFVLFSCSSSNCTSKPLKDIDKYQVALFVSPYGDLDGDEIKKLLKEKLTTLGKVVEAKVPISEENPLLFISVESTGGVTPSSIRVLGKVKVLKNSCELTSVIWSHFLEAQEESIPVERNGAISFEKREKTRTSQNDLLDSLLNAFIEEYRGAHPGKDSPVFLISHQK